MHPADISVQSIAFYANEKLIFEGGYRYYEIPWQPTEAGAYEVIAVAKDNLGATNALPSASVIVNTPPTVSVRDPALAGPLLSPATFTAQADASDADGQVVRVDFFYLADATHVQNLGSAVAPPFQVEVKGLVGIGGILRAVAVDNYGATTGKSLPLRLLGLNGDDFYRPFVLPQGPCIAHANNSAATRQPQEPALSLYNAPATLWWSWTVPSNCVVFVNTSGSLFDTSLGVFTGTNLAQLKFVAENDDDPTNPPLSRVKFEAVGGTTYNIVVGSGVPAELGDVVLNLQTQSLTPGITMPAPSNDYLTNCIVLEGTNISVTGSNVGATNEALEPSELGLSPHKSVWWKWTAPASDRVNLSTAGSDFDTVLAVCTGSGLMSSLGRVMANDDTPDALTSELNFEAVQGRAYYFSVDGFAGASGNVKLTLLPSPHEARPTPPENDNVVKSCALSGVLVVTNGSNDGATTETGEPSHAGQNSYHSVWWKWTAPESGPVFVSAHGRSPQNPFMEFWLVLGIYTMTSESSLQPEASGRPVNKGNNLWTTVTRFQAEAGRTYYLAAAGASSTSGNITLTVNAGLKPAFLSLELLELRPDGQARLAIRSSYARNVELQVSPNLTEWTKASTHYVGDRLEVLMPQATNTGTRCFYRAISRE